MHVSNMTVHSLAHTMVKAHANIETLSVTLLRITAVGYGQASVTWLIPAAEDEAND